MNTIAALVMMASIGLAEPPSIKLEDSGAKRDQKDAMQLKPFDASLLTKLGGDKVDPESFKGKVVLLVTWSSWYKTSHDSLKLAETLNKKFGAKGLVVLGVHHQKGFDNAPKVMQEQGATFPDLLDTTGAFRTALVVDQDPDFYLVDRAGNMRYADVTTDDVEKAVEYLVTETAEEAAAVPGKLASDAAKKEADKWKTKDAGMKPGQVLDVPFTKPDDSAYTEAKWPEQNKEQLSAMNAQGQPLPAALGSETFITHKPKMDGRVVVLDFWATWCGPCRKAMPKLDKLQQDYSSDLVVLGISDEPESKVRPFVEKSKHSYSIAFDTSKTVAGSLQVQGIPHVVVLSTDGVIRWQGNPHEDGFLKAVQDTIKADPGVKARQAAETEYLKKKAKA